MAISRGMMERQLRAGGGIMTLDEPRQGYFLGKIVRKAKKAVKKVVKSPLGKLALGAAAANFAPMLFGKKTLLQSAGGLGGLLSKIRSGEGFLGQIGNVFRQGGDKDNPFSIFRLAGGAAGLGALAAPFLMGGDEEEVDPGVDVSGIQPMVSNIRQQARDFYKNPASRADSGLYFMPQQQFVQPSFFAAGGGLADIPREGYKSGELVEKLSMLTPAGLGMAAGKKLAEGIKDNENMMMAGSDRYQMILEEIIADMESMLGRELTNEEYDLAGKKAYERLYDFGAAEGGLADIPRGGYNEGKSVLSKEQMTMIKQMKDKGSDIDTISSITGVSLEEVNKFLTSLNQKAEGGIMDLGGMEKDYREGGFVPIGAEERADDVPARLSKNEFVFTADAVRNAGGGDIDKGAEVIQNMMDNLEAGGMISEESQGKENPAQAMFDQPQMLEGRLA